MTSFLVPSSAADGEGQWGPFWVTVGERGHTHTDNGLSQALSDRLE